MRKKGKENKLFLYSSGEEAKTEVGIDRERLLPTIPHLRLPPKA